MFFPLTVSNTMHWCIALTSAGWGGGAFLQRSGCLQSGGHGRCRPCSRPTAPKSAGRSAADVPRGQPGAIFLVCIGGNGGGGVYFYNSGALLLLFLFIAAPKIKRGGGFSKSSSSLDFLLCRLKKLSGNQLPSPQNLPKLPKD